jgi:hypothetical protein
VSALISFKQLRMVLRMAGLCFTLLSMYSSPFTTPCRFRMHSLIFVSYLSTIFLSFFSAFDSLSRSFDFYYTAARLCRISYSIE